MNCIEKIRVYNGKYGYSTSFPIYELNEKKEKEIVGNEYLTVQFQKGDEPEIKEGTACEIELIESFLCAWQSKDQKKSGLKLVVLDYEKPKTKRK